MPKTKPYFNPVSPNVDFPELERKILDYWYKNGVVKKYLGKNKSSKNFFSFLDGPITANNPMGVHHAWGRTYKDLWQRFYNMRGYRQRFQNGFDCQGLWVEVEVEKELGLKSKKEIENLVPGDKKASIAKFVELCKQRVYKYAKIQTEQSKRLGYFMDWDNSYYTLSEDNNYMIWYFLKKCYDKRLIYKGKDSVPWCPRCGTAISQHEMLTEDYKEVTHNSVYIRYPISGRKNEYLLVWTTTPWTLPGNVAVALDKNLDYVLATSGVNGNIYYLSEFAARKLDLKIKEKIKGSQLVNLKYESVFDILPRVFKSIADFGHKVLATDETILPISQEEGTGIVHVAPGAGSEDFQLGKKLNLPVIELIDEEANYLSDLGEFSGKNAKDNPAIILNFLKTYNNGKYLFDIKSYTHRYPACWRCKTELVWRVVEEWYIAMEPLRESLKKVVRKIKWIPEFGLKRELDWIENMQDWLISKKRYWGLALPIWECRNCGYFEVIGGKEELRQKAVRGWEYFKGNTPHRPFIDEIKISCSKCGSIVERIPDVGNPWLDAGIVPFSTISKDNKSAPLYLKNRKEFLSWYPVDFITESFPGQFKNWFYSLIAMSTVLENQAPVKTILGFATLLAEDGRPMHKSWGNAIEFNEGAEKIGVDVMRFMYVRQNPSDNLLFGYKIADETRRRFHLMLWNIYNFFITYANLDGWTPIPKKGISFKNPLDVWAEARLIETIIGVTDLLKRYDAQTASEFIEKYVSDLSLWYIRRSRNRVGIAAMNDLDKNDFYETCYQILVVLCKILAPFTPFLADAIFTNIVKQIVSVHLVDWPDQKFIKSMQKKLGGEKEVKKLINQMDLIRKIAEKGHSQRKKHNLPVRQPLNSITIFYDQRCDLRLISLIKEELNVKKVIWKQESELRVKLDTKIDSKLKEEAEVRELIRKIQQERKRIGVSLKDKIFVYNNWLPRDKRLFDLLKTKTLAENIKKGKFKVIRSS